MAKARGARCVCTTSRYPRPATPSGCVGVRWSSVLARRQRKRHHSASRQTQRKARKRKRGRQTIQYQRPARGMSPKVWLDSNDAVFPDKWSCAANRDISAVAASDVASGIQESPPSCDAPDFSLQFRQSGSRRHAGTNDRRDKFPRLRIKCRFAQEQQRNDHQQSNMPANHREGKELFAIALKRSQCDEDQPRKQTEGDPQRDRVASVANEAQSYSKPVKRAAEKREFPERAVDNL